MLDLINYSFGLGVACWISNLCIEGAESGIFISMSRILRTLKTYILSFKTPLDFLKAFNYLHLDKSWFCDKYN